MKALDFLVKNEITRFIGVSNFSVEQIMEAQKHATQRIVANQIEYNLITRNNGSLTRGMESQIIPYCQQNKILVIAFTPLAKGKLAQPGIPLLDELAEKYRKTPAQIALNWLISKPNLITIPKTIKINHLKENLLATGWRLSQEDRRRLDHEFPLRDTPNLDLTK
jgi:diketogulonate reductase-like aldo/keto reductase